MKRQKKKKDYVIAVKLNWQSSSFSFVVVYSIMVHLAITDILDLMKYSNNNT